MGTSLLPSPYLVHEPASPDGASSRQFQNRRAKVKKLKERADRDTAPSSHEGNSPPRSGRYEKSPNMHPASVSELPTPPSTFPGVQSYPPRTIYGQDVIAQQRASPPSNAYGSMSYLPPPQPGSSTQPLSHPRSVDYHANGYAPHSAYQSTVYTTTVASSTYATNEYPAGPPPFPLLSHDHYNSRRYSLPAMNGEHAPSLVPTPSEPPATSAGYPPFQPPTSTAFASSAFTNSVAPSSIEGAQSAGPPYSSYSYAPQTLNPPYHERRASYASDALLFDPSSQTTSTYAPTIPVSSSYDVPGSSSYLPPPVPTPADPFSTFDPLAPVSPTVLPLATNGLNEEHAMNISGSRLLERRASVAHQHRQSNRLKPYDPNERRSPGLSLSPHSQP